MPPHNASRMHQLRSSAARLVRLAAVACLALAAVSAAVWAQPVGVVTTGHRCIHDEVQQRVLRSAALQHNGRDALPAVGVPVVAAESTPTAEHRGIDYALADSTSPPVERSDDWGQLRITVSFEDLMDPERYCAHVGQTVNNHNGANVKCGEADILTDKKRDILINSLIPQAVQLHTDRLKVRQVKGNLVVNGMTDDACGDFKVPEWHRTTGFNNTDFLLYVASVPSESDVVSWGSWCQVFLDGRPAIGVINIPAAVIVSAYDQRAIRAVAHEIAHALGFSDTFFFVGDIMNLVSNVRGKTSEVPAIVSNTTVTKAREHYGCDNLEYVELEDQDDDGSEDSHLKMRNAKDELMAPEVRAGYYTALTMAIFEDMGFYKADFSKAEAMAWGRNAGCDFLEKKCMGNNITKWPLMFCNRTQPQLRCTSSRLEMGKCGPSFTFGESASHSHSSTQTIYDNGLIMGSCPYVAAERDGACNQDTSTAPYYMSTFNVFSDAARCIDGAFTPNNKNTDSRPILGMCANVQCDNTTSTYSVQVKGSRDYVNCTEGQNITLDTISDAFEAGGYITCPPYVEVCQGNVKAAMDFKADLERNRGTSSSSGRGHYPTDSNPSHGKGDRLNPRGNGAAGLRSTWSLVSAGVALLVATLTVGLSA